MENLTAEEMRAVELEAIESGRVSGLELMERAGRGVVEAIFEEWPDLGQEEASDKGVSPSRTSKDGGSKPPRGGHRAIVLCGPGNNGGDGFVVARLLHDDGWQVEVHLYWEIDKLPPDARRNCDRWAEIGDITQLDGECVTRSVLGDVAVIVDALFGTGLTRPLEGLSKVLSLMEETARGFDGKHSATRVVAVDLPSGIHTDTGTALKPSHGGCGAARANLTVTFHRAKLGHVRGDGPAACGKLVVKDIGL